MNHPFHGPGAHILYATEERTRQRSGALLSAKTAGRNVSEVILGFADDAVLPCNPRILDVGCGQGQTALRLARRFRNGKVVAIDASQAMAEAAAKRTSGEPVAVVVADFHKIPLAEQSFDLATAVMCLYHSPTPERVIEQLARTLRPNGTALLVTKATDSYRELATLLATAEIDPNARERPSLYEMAHSDNLADIAALGSLRVKKIQHEVHRFTFKNLAHAAAYLATCPQYELPPELHRAESLAEALRARLPDSPVTTSATITYLAGRAR